MKYNFDEEIGRKGTNSGKWEFVPREGDPTKFDHTDQFFGEDRLLPMWVADMDFRCAQPIVEALAARVQHGIFGYSMATDSYYQAVVAWMHRRHGWAIQPEWIVTSPGVVAALNFLMRTLVGLGDRVLIQTPVYAPFYRAVLNAGGEVCGVPMICQDGGYQMDFAAVEAQARNPRVKATILCSPHNPVGRVWTPDELRRFGEICLANDVLVIADEIHGDLIMKGITFTPFATLGKEFQQRSVTCTAPSKTFNMAGLHTSNIIIADPELRSRFQTTIRNLGVSGASMFGMVALEAAYTHGEEWLEQALDYINGNLETLRTYLAENIPQVTLIPLEGTYLAWLDCRELGLDGEALRRLMTEDARVYLDQGTLFGPEGEGFERINIACPRPLLLDALARIKGAVDRLANRAGASG